MQIKLFTNSAAWIGFIFAMPILGLMVFSVQKARGGLQRSERVKQAGGSFLLNQYVMEYGYWWLNKPVLLLIKMRISPNSITFAGFAVVLIGVVLQAYGYFGLGGPIILVGSLSDMLDGLVARQQGLCSDAGEFVDAMIDRYADIALFGGLLFYYANRPLILMIVFAALVGSIMVSYARAKAESLGIYDAPGGMMRRAERAVYLGFGIMLAPLFAEQTEAASDKPVYYLVVTVCCLIAVLANLSALKISLYVNRRLQQKQTSEHVTC